MSLLIFIQQIKFPECTLFNGESNYKIYWKQTQESLDWNKIESSRLICLEEHVLLHCVASGAAYGTFHN